LRFVNALQAQGVTVLGVQAADVTVAVLSGALIIQGFNDPATLAANAARNATNTKKTQFALGLGVGIGGAVGLLLAGLLVAMLVQRRKTQGVVPGLHRGGRPEHTRVFYKQLDADGKYTLASTPVAAIFPMQLRQLPAAGSQRKTQPSQRTTRRASRTPLRVNALLKQASGLAVSWRQTVDNVLIDVPVDPQASQAHGSRMQAALPSVPSFRVRGRDLKFELHPRRLALSLHGEPLLAGSLEDCGAINLDDSFWTLEEGPGPEGGTRKWVAISLGKRTSGYNSWDTLLESERMDTRVTDRCFLELAVGEQVIGKVAIGLFGNVVPRTAANFKALCTGERGVGELGKPLHFKGSSFHRIIPGFMAQGGDITANNGTGGDSIYGPKWEDENFKVKHDEAGLLAMANAGPGTNSSQFYVLFKPAPHLDGKHVVFGKVLGGMNLVRRLEDLGSSSGRPQQPVTITDCGLLESDKEVEQVIDANKLLQLEQAMQRNEAPLEEEPEWLSDIGGEEEPDWLANIGGEDEKLLEDFGEEGGLEGEEEGVWEGEGEAEQLVAGAEGKGEERVAGAEGKGEERVAGAEGKGEERVAGAEGKGGVA
ncbi:hypothetical protein QJQ45_029659, partial [Haematococcus lacustris]